MGRKLSLERFAERALESTGRVVEQLRPLARPLGSDRDLDPLIERVGDAKCVLLGEASHGTSEFYTWRARITRRLIEERGFRFVAVEGDWPDCYRVNRFVRGLPGSGGSAEEVLHAFDRWPTWMWANREVAAFAHWLRAHNDARPAEQRVGFYGLDVYSLWDSMREVTQYLDRVDPEAARRARRAYECFAPYEEDEQQYARATALVPVSCEGAVVKALAELRKQAPTHEADGDREAYFEAEQNAIVARNAELYYRTMVRGGASSWNVRDGHMVETLERLMALHGSGARAVVWEHNTHVGDARYTDMADEGEFNVGQRAREVYGDDNVVLVGFSTYRGTVVAGDEWGAPMRVMPVPAGREGSYEDVFHRMGGGDKLLLVGQAPSTPELLAPRGHRAIGVVYRPQYESYGNYVPTVLPRRYDALLFVERTRALVPLHLMERHDGEAPETYPFGV
jgi:erythromycin esterase-like protein